jgi:hypothetical protein
MICRIPGSLLRASIDSPTELSHLIGRFWRTTVELEETLEAVEDLLTCGSNNFWVSESFFADGLDVVLQRENCKDKGPHSRELLQLGPSIVRVVGIEGARQVEAG